MIKKQLIIPLLALLCLIPLLSLGPIPQDKHYHNFADQRKVWIIPNFLNVVTNLLFAISGFMGILKARNTKAKNIRFIFFTLFTGFLLVTLGSSYYHLIPNNNTLIWDRIPIVFILMSFFAFIIYNAIDERVGYRAFFILNICGLASVAYWAFSEAMGHGDLRWYGMVQFFPIVAIPVILLLYKPSVQLRKDVFFIFLLFGVAKLCEKFDNEIFSFLHNSISGHSLKHIFMAIAGFKIMIMTPQYCHQTGEINNKIQL